jgi:hypothetical protein
MTPVDAPPLTAGLAEAVRAKLQQAPAPLKLAEVVKGLPKAKKAKVSEHQEVVRKMLEEEVRLGRAFCHPSGKNGEPRYWCKDEENLLREKALEIAATPLSLSALVTAAGKEVKGADKSFVEGRLRQLIREDLLYEHPQHGKKGGALFGASPPPPPPPPLQQDQHRKAVEKLAADCRKLLTAASATAEELFTALRARLLATAPALKEKPAAVSAADLAEANAESRNGAPALPPPPPPFVPPLPALASPRNPGLEQAILQAAGSAPVRSIAEVRREMPEDLQGRAFDDAVLRLADERLVMITQDCDISQLPQEERDGGVRDGKTLFTTISRAKA